MTNVYIGGGRLFDSDLVRGYSFLFVSFRRWHAFASQCVKAARRLHSGGTTRRMSFESILETGMSLPMISEWSPLTLGLTIEPTLTHTSRWNCLKPHRTPPPSLPSPRSLRATHCAHNRALLHRISNRPPLTSPRICRLSRHICIEIVADTLEGCEEHGAAFQDERD